MATQDADVLEIVNGDDDLTEDQGNNGKLKEKEKRTWKVFSRTTLVVGAWSVFVVAICLLIILLKSDAPETEVTTKSNGVDKPQMYQTVADVVQDIVSSSGGAEEYRPLTRVNVDSSPGMPIYTEGYLVAGRLQINRRLSGIQIHINGSNSNMRGLVGKEVCLRKADQASEAVVVSVVDFVGANRSPIQFFLAYVSEDLWKTLKVTTNDFFEILSVEKGN